jgi:hypothetical protein
MEYVSVSSSNVAAVGYDDATNTLGVRFLNGSEYHYFGVPRDVYDALRGASSVGTYFNANVKKAGYGYAQIS